MAIFEHEDNVGDAFEIGDSPRAGELAIYWAEDNASYVNLPRSVVRDLRDALNRWLDEQQRHDPNPAGSNTAPPYETLVRRLVAEEVARVLPLYQGPQAAVVPEHRPQECPGATCPEYATNTGLRLCTVPECNTPGDAYHAEHDPEPQAVGHPEAPGIDWTDKSGVRYEYCTECGHVWGAHSPSDVRHGCGAILGKGPCGCEAVRPERPAVCTECGHSWVIHAPDDSRPGCVGGSLNRSRCGCEAIRPERPAECECGHSWADHGRFGIRGCGVLPCECSRAVPRSENSQGSGECSVCGVKHVGAHPLQPCKCGHCSRQHAGSYGYGDCGKCECVRYAR